MKNTRWMILIALLSLVISVGTLRRGHDWGDDFASYIMQAQSIIDGNMQNFVEHNSFTVLESSYTIGPASYPWGYPLALVPVILLRGTHPLLLKLPGILFFVAFLFSLYFLTKNRLTPTESLLLVSLFAFNPTLLDFTDQILSDIPFLFLSTVTLVCMISENRQTKTGSLLIGITTAFAFFIRTQGILLLASYLLLETWNAWTHRVDKTFLKRNIAGMVWAMMGFGVPWLIYVWVFPGGGESYFAQYSEFQVATVFQFVERYFLVFSSFFGKNIIGQLVYYVLFILFIVGAWTRRKQEAIFIVFFGVWMFFLITWPYWQGLRFIFPLLPIFIYFAFWGVRTLITKFVSQQQRGQTLANVLFLAIAFAFFGTSTLNAYNNLKSGREIAGPFDPYSDELFEFIKDNTPVDSVVIFFKPRAMRLFTDRDSVMVLECDRLSLGDYVAIHKKWDNSQIPPDQLDECGVPLSSVFENRRFVVYQILK